nr:hypothetical protein [Methanosarcina horonobensis]
MIGTMELICICGIAALLFGATNFQNSLGHSGAVSESSEKQNWKLIKKLKSLKINSEVFLWMRVEENF